MSTDRRRIDAGRQFAGLLASPDFRAFIREEYGAADLPIVMALPEDQVGPVFDRLDGRSPALVVVFDDGLHVIRFDPHDATDECEQIDINVNSTIAMFLTLLRSYPGVYVCRLVTTQGHFELIEDGRREEIPV